MSVSGSSPQARGTVEPSNRARPFLRFIPAGAGNGCSARIEAGVEPVHPRRRGERSPLTRVGGDHDGSSPQARGTAGTNLSAYDSLRFIPAGAGNGAEAAKAAAHEAVHPRRRGERSRTGTSARKASGSSPQARGTGRELARPRHHLRFIPAGAGNGSSATKSVSASPVHPRRRGERDLVDSDVTVASGSSPQARGTVRNGLRDLDRRRFIPAGAGNGSGFPWRTGRWPVHPRRRGERLWWSRIKMLLAGSSPQARGTVGATLLGGSFLRFIPAGAGNGLKTSTCC